MLRRERKRNLPVTEDRIRKIQPQKKPTSPGPSGKGVDIQPAEPRSVENQRTQESENALKGRKEEETISDERPDNSVRATPIPNMQQVSPGPSHLSLAHTQ